MAKLVERDIKFNERHPFTVQFQICWSKNVVEEREAPWQILFGSDDPDFCPLLALAVYLESSAINQNRSPDGPHFLFEPDATRPQLVARVRNTLNREVFQAEQFKQLHPGRQEPVGTHSIRKLAGTYGRQNGCSIDEVEFRGRWKHKKVVNVYMDPNAPYIDAKVAGALCVGGPIKYKLRPGSNISIDWMMQHAVPNIHRRYPYPPGGLPATLALPLIWNCCNASADTSCVDRDQKLSEKSPAL
jgi:hypothetical protein